MPTDTTFRTRAEEVLDATLERMETLGHVAPGTRAELLPKLKADGLGSPEAAVAKLFAALDGPGGARYASPDYEPPKGVLARVLAALPISDRARRNLTEALSLAANSRADVASAVRIARETAERHGTHFDPHQAEAEARAGAAGRVAELVVSRLEQRDCRDHWQDHVRPELPANERRAFEAISAFSDFHSRSVDLADLARQWADIGNRSHIEARKVVAMRLQQPYYARVLCVGGEPAAIGPQDPALQPTRGEQDRAAAARADHLRLNSEYMV